MENPYLRMSNYGGYQGNDFLLLATGGEATAMQPKSEPQKSDAMVRFANWYEKNLVIISMVQWLILLLLLAKSLKK